MSSAYKAHTISNPQNNPKNRHYYLYFIKQNQRLREVKLHKTIQLIETSTVTFHSPYSIH